jgi:glutathione S-transferase
VITLYHAERTRSVRVVWLLEELGLPYELRKVQFAPPVRGFFSQATPLGKLPVIEDDGMLMAESGAILEYIVERHGGGRLAPAPGSRLRGPHLLYKRDAESVPEVVEDARGRARSGLAFVERALEGRAAFQRASTR